MKSFKRVVFVLSLLVIPLIVSTISTNNTRATIPQNNVSDYKVEQKAITTTKFTGTRNVTCFVGPDSAFDLINETLYAAQTSIVLEVYTLSSQALVDALIDADGRGVLVTVLLSYDRVSGVEDDYTERAAWKLDNVGILVAWTTTDYRFTHAKFWVIDSEITFVYSGNWAPTSIPVENSARVNREMGFMFTDTDIATYYEDVFNDDFLISTPYSTTADGVLQAEETTLTYSPQFAIPEVVVGSMEVIPIFSPDNSEDLLSSLIDNATTTLDLELQYIKDDCPVVDELIDAANRGVATRVIIPNPSPDPDEMAIVQSLLENGASVRFFKGLNHNHNKYIAVDGEYVCISSINFSNTSVSENREAGAIVKNTNVATYFKQVFDYDWSIGEIPTGYIQPVTIVSPKQGAIVSGTHNIQANFAINTYTSGTVKIDSILIHTWTNPDGLESHSVDFSAYSEGIHIITITGTPTVGSDVIVEGKFNIIDDTVDWLVLISEVRYDGTAGPTELGEFFEVFNGFSFEVHIGGWKISDNEDDYTIPLDTTISAEDMLIFVRDATTFINEMSALGITGITPDIIYIDIALANTGDELLMLDPEDNLLDACVWGTGSVAGHTSWTGSMDDTKSLHRDPANVDTDDCSVDFIVDTPDPGTVYISVVPSGFIPGFIITTTLAAIVMISIFSRFLIKKRK